MPDKLILRIILHIISDLERKTNLIHHIILLNHSRLESTCWVNQIELMSKLINRKMEIMEKWKWKLKKQKIKYCDGYNSYNRARYNKVKPEMKDF